MVYIIAWVNGWPASKQISEEEIKEFPHLLKWIDRIAAVSYPSVSLAQICTQKLIFCSVLLFREASGRPIRNEE